MESGIAWPIYPGCLYSYTVKCRRRYIFIVKLIKTRSTPQITFISELHSCCSSSTLFFNILVYAEKSSLKVKMSHT